MTDSHLEHSGASRTWLCTVVFLDIVGYSKHTVDHQLEIKEHFNRLVSDAIQDVAEKERIILDTGDGAALCFLGDPENALLSAINLRNVIGDANKSAHLPYEVCIGINLGPVKLIKDVNGRENAVGDGINTAQRIMGFSAPGQILVSRSYYEVISCLGEDFARLFHYQGVHADKHVRKHTVYEVRPGGNDEAGIVVDTTEAAIAVSSVPDEAVSPGFDATRLAEIEHALAEQIGPLARALVKRYAADSSSIQELCTRLAGNIPDDQARQQFEVCFAGSASTGDSGSQPARVAPDPGFEPDQELVAGIEAFLLRELGPVAKILIRKGCRETSSASALIEYLAREIDDPDCRKSFQQQFQGSVD